MAFRVSQLSKKGKYREEKKMGFIFEKRLPKPEEIREQFPLTGIKKDKRRERYRNKKSDYRRRE